MATRGNKTKAVDVPLRDRRWIVGYAELMGYLVRPKTVAALEKYYINEGLRPIVTPDGVKRWDKSAVDEWIIRHDQTCVPCVRSAYRKAVKIQK